MNNNQMNYNQVNYNQVNYNQSYYNQGNYNQGTNMYDNTVPPQYNAGYMNSDYMNRLNNGMDFTYGMNNGIPTSYVNNVPNTSQGGIITKIIRFILDKLFVLAIITSVVNLVYTFMRYKDEYDTIYMIVLPIVLLISIYGIVPYIRIYKHQNTEYKVGMKIISYVALYLFFIIYDGPEECFVFLAVGILSLVAINAFSKNATGNLLNMVLADMAVSFALLNVSLIIMTLMVILFIYYIIWNQIKRLTSETYKDRDLIESLRKSMKKIF